MPSKKIQVKSYVVKAHERTIYTRTFKLICAHCSDEVERTTYATTCPKYGNKCNDKWYKCLRNKKRTSQPT